MRVGQVVDRPADVDRDDVGALLRQAHRVAAALAAGGAADERDLALDPAGHQGTSGGQGFPAAHRRRRAERGVGQIGLPLREALEDFLQGDAAFQPGQRRAQAEVGADAEREVRPGGAMDVEFARVGTELPLVAAGGPDQHHHHAAFRHRLVIEADVAGHIAGHVRRGRLEAQQLLDRLRDESGVFDEFAALVGVLRENLARPTDQPRRRFVARAGHHVEVHEDLLASQPPGGAGLVDELDVEQLGHDVVGRIVGTPVDVGLELLADGQAMLGGTHRLAGLGA